MRKKVTYAQTKSSRNNLCGEYINKIKTEIDKVDRIFGEPIRYYKMNDDDRHLKKILEQKQQKRIQKEIDLHNNIVKHYNFEVDDLEQEMHFETKRVNRVKPSRIIIKYPEA